VPDRFDPRDALAAVLLAGACLALVRIFFFSH